MARPRGPPHEPLQTHVGEEDAKHEEVEDEQVDFAVVLNGAAPRYLLLVRTANNRAAELGEVLIDRRAVVVQRGRLQDNACRAGEHGQREDPQEQSVQHHRHELPVLLHLWADGMEEEHSETIGLDDTVRHPSLLLLLLIHPPADQNNRCVEISSGPPLLPS